MDALKGTPAKGYLLEMFFIFKCDMALATVTDETPASWTVKAESFLKEKKDERFTIKFRKIVKNVDLDSLNDSDWESGTVLVLQSFFFAFLNSNKQ